MRSSQHTSTLGWRRISGLGVACILLCPVRIPALAAPPATLPSAAGTVQDDVLDVCGRLGRAVAEGDDAAIRALCFAESSEDAQKLDDTAALLYSLAHLRSAFDAAYGRGSLGTLGFRDPAAAFTFVPETKVELDGDSATVAVPGRRPMTLRRTNGAWKLQAGALWPSGPIHAEGRRIEAFPLERRRRNLKAIAILFENVAAGVSAGKYVSAADAYGALNARLHGQAGDMSILAIAAAIDISPDAAATRPAPTAVPVVELSGSPAALGKAHGEQLGETIRTLKKDYFQQYLARAGNPAVIEAAMKATVAFFEPYIRPEHLAEIHALAAASGLDPAEALAAQCFTDLTLAGGCSTITLPAEASPDGVARFGRNLDFPSFGILDGHNIVLVIRPEKGYAFAAVTYPGLVGVLSGMNEHGLTLANMEVRRRRRPPEGMPYMLLYRALLEECRTVDEAIALLEKTPRQSANNLMLMDAAGHRALAEITPEAVRVRRAAEGQALISTNHQRGPDLDTPGRCVRFDVLHDAARRQFGAITPRAIEEMLTGAAQGDDTIQSMIFEPADRVIYLAVCAAAPNHGFARIDLKRYFGKAQAE